MRNADTKDEQYQEAGNVYTRRDGMRVYGYIHDAGSEGGAGMNRFGEVVLSRQ